MLEKIVDLFMKFRFSPWWYLVIILFVSLCYKIFVSAKRKSEIKYDRIQKILLLSIGIPLLIIILMYLLFFVPFGFVDSLSDNIEMVMMMALGIILLAIPLMYKLLQKRK